MTKIFKTILRCPSCGNRTLYYIECDNIKEFYDCYDKYESRLFADTDCFKCIANTRLDVWV